jgi:hypothetical protein
MSTLETNLIQPSTGTSLTIGASGDTITIPSGATIANSGTATGFGDLTPSFFANASTNQDISSATSTKVTLGNEAYDTDSAFADSRFTVPSGEAGKYFFNFAIDCHSLAVDNLEIGQAMIYKNGSLVSEHVLDFRDHPARRASVASTLVLDLSVSDYIELYANIRDASGSPRITGDSGISTYLGGFKILGA